MSLEDKLAIQEMIAQYSYTYDSKDAEGCANLFTEDAVMEFFRRGDTQPHNRYASRVSIRDEYVLQHSQRRPAGRAVRHYQTGTVFDELTADTAQTRTMMLATFRDATEATPRLRWSGVCHDQWRKTSEGWRIVRRAFHGDGQSPR
jgi:hypothetical protein